MKNVAHFISSCGELYVNFDGTIGKESEISDWLLDISKVDVEELENYYKLNNLIGALDGGDVLDFGWWDKEGEYNKPEKSWRLEVFHNQDFDEAKVLGIVEKSFGWIDKNRK